MLVAKLTGPVVQHHAATEPMRWGSPSATALPYRQSVALPQCVAASRGVASGWQLPLSCLPCLCCLLLVCRLPLASRPELGDGGNMRPVVDLLVEQVECADFILLNKVDLLPGGAQGEALEQLSAIVSSLNPLATVIACEQAQVRGSAPQWARLPRHTVL